MASGGPPATSRWLLLRLLLLLPPPHIHQGWVLGHVLSTQRSPDLPAREPRSGPGREPVAVMTFYFTKIAKTSSSSEFRTWDPEGVIFYGDTNAEEDWFVLGLRDGWLEIQLHSHWAQLTVGAGPRVDDGRWHQAEAKIAGDSVLLWVDGDEMLRLRQVYGPLADAPQPLMRIALGAALPSLQTAAARNYVTRMGMEAMGSLTWQRVVLTSGAGLRLDLPVVLGLPLQLKLAASTVILNQGPKTEVFAVLPEDLTPLLQLWAQCRAASSWALYQVRTFLPPFAWMAFGHKDRSWTWIRP